MRKIQDYFFKFAAMPLKLTTYHRGSRIPELPGTDTFHSTECSTFMKQLRDMHSLLIVASENGIPVAKLLAAIRKSVRLFPPAIIKRCEVYGTGEYFDETLDREAVFSDMLPNSGKPHGRSPAGSLPYRVPQSGQFVVRL